MTCPPIVRVVVPCPPGPSTVVTAAEELRDIAAYLLHSSIDIYGSVQPNFTRRAIAYRRPVGSQLWPSIIPREAWSTSGLINSLRFFVGMDMRDELDALLNDLLAMQWRDDRKATYGAFQSVSLSGAATVVNTAAAIIGLIDAYALTEREDVKYAADLAGQFLLRMHDPNPFYQATYGVTPIPFPTHNGFTWNAFCCQVDPNDDLRRTVSLWDCRAVWALERLYELTGTAAYHTVSLACRDFYFYAVQHYFECFAIYDTGPQPHCNDVWPVEDLISNVRDHAWHRRGESVLAVPPWGSVAYPKNTLGSDQPEYALEALYEVGYNLAALRAAYDDMASFKYVLGDTTDTATSVIATGFDPHICRPGYLRAYDTSPNYYTGAPQGVSGATAVMYGDNYDWQGMAQFAHFQKEQYPADYALTLPIMLDILKRGTLGKADLTNKTSIISGFESYTEGTANVVANVAAAVARLF